MENAGNIRAISIVELGNEHFPLEVLPGRSSEIVAPQGQGLLLPTPPSTLAFPGTSPGSSALSSHGTLPGSFVLSSPGRSLR